MWLKTITTTVLETVLMIRVENTTIEFKIVTMKLKIEKEI